MGWGAISNRTELKLKRPVGIRGEGEKKVCRTGMDIVWWSSENALKRGKSLFSEFLPFNWENLGFF